MDRKLVLAGLLALVSLPLRAWDPSGAAQTKARLAELRAELKELPPQVAAKAKEARARQPAAPAWVHKTAWTVEEGGKLHIYGVGAATGIKSTALRVRMAELKARAAVASLTGAVHHERLDEQGSKMEKLTVEGEVSAQPVDWYEAQDGTLWALVVEVR